MRSNNTHTKQELASFAALADLNHDLRFSGKEQQTLLDDTLGEFGLHVSLLQNNPEGQALISALHKKDSKAVYNMFQKDFGAYFKNGIETLSKDQMAALKVHADIVASGLYNKDLMENPAPPPPKPKANTRTK